MMKDKLLFQVTGTVNAGICLVFPNQRKIWIDLYPDGKTPMFSHLKEAAWEQTKKDPRLSPPDLILFTHTHRDHFSAARTKEVNLLWPEVPVLLPAGSVWDGNIVREELAFLPIHSERFEYELDGIRILMLRTVHSGKEYEDVPHYSFLFTFQGKHIFLSGDAALADERLEEFLEWTRADLAILTFPWGATNRGRELVGYTVQPSHLLLYHIPDREDDRFSYRSAAVSGAGQLPCPDVRLLMQNFQTETYEL